MKRKYTVVVLAAVMILSGIHGSLGVSAAEVQNAAATDLAAETAEVANDTSDEGQQGDNSTNENQNGEGSTDQGDISSVLEQEDSAVTEEESGLTEDSADSGQMDGETAITEQENAEQTDETEAGVDDANVAADAPAAQEESIEPAFSTSEAETTGSGYTFVIDSDTDAAVITGYDGSSSTMTIPSTVTSSDGTTHTVTTIGASAFQGMSSITSVVIPDTVTEIRQYAFNKCTNLSSISWGSNVTTLSYRSFGGCSSLKTVTIPKSVTESTTASLYNYKGTFDGSDNIWKVVFEDGMEKIPGNICYNMDGLTTVVIPESVTEIGGSAFGSCDALQSVSFPSKLVTIDGSAFESSGLTSVTIPEYVTEIGAYAFNNCASLSSVKLNENLTTLYYRSFGGTNKLTEITIPNSVKESKTASLYNYQGTFNGCENLKKVIFEEGIETIPANICYGTNGLQEVVLPQSVTEIGGAAFASCEALKSISLPEYLTTIGWSSFASSGLTSITIPDYVTEIGAYAFNKCASLSSVSLNENLETLYYRSFGECSSLTEITIPNSVTQSKTATLYNYKGTFYGCENLVRIIFEDGIKTIPANICYGTTGLQEVVIPESVTEIGSDAFNNCKALISIPLPSGLTAIKGGAFRYCTSLQAISLPDGLAEIGNYTFAGSGLTEFSSPETVTTFGTHMFDGCKSLEKAVLSDHIAKVPDSTFKENAALTDVRIGEECTSIDTSAFNGCTALTALTIPGNVTTIGNYAFSGCTSLASIELPVSVQWIGVSGFYGCTALTSVKLPDRLLTIGNYAFQGCTKLPSIVIPDSVNSLGNSAFNGCSALADVTLGTGIPKIQEQTFYKCTSLPKIVIPYGVTSIGSKAFNSDTSLKEAVIPSSVTTINDDAFSYKMTIYGRKGSYAETYAGKNAKFTFVDNTVPATAIKITAPDSIVPVNRQMNLAVVFTPADATDAVTWTSSDTTLATVSETGVVKGVAKGTVTITAVAEDASVTGSIELTIADKDNDGTKNSTEGTGFGEYYDGIAMTLSDTIDLNVYMSLPEKIYDAPAGCYMEFTFPDGHVYKSYVADAKLEKRSSDYIFKCEVPAKNITDDITAQLVIPDNRRGKKFTISAKSYLSYVWAKGGSGDYKKAAPVAKALLNYGAMAQQYFGYKTSDLAASGGVAYTDVDLSAVTASTLSSYGRNGNPSGGKGHITYAGTGLITESGTGLDVHFRNQSGTAGKTIHFSDQQTGEEYSGTIGEEFNIGIPGISILDLGESHKLVSDDDGYTVTVNPLAYINTVLNRDDSSDSLKNLMRALYLYYQAAVAYQNG